VNRLGTLVLLLVSSRVAVADGDLGVDTNTDADTDDRDEAMVGAPISDHEMAVEQAARWLAVRVASETAVDGARGVIGVDATLSERLLDDVQGQPTAWTLDGAGRLELGGSKAGAEASTSGTIVARGLLEPAATDQVAPIEVVLSWGLWRRPELSDPRRAVRDVTTSAGAAARFPLAYFRRGRSRHGAFEVRLGASITLQGDRVLKEYVFDNRIYYWCHVRDGAAPPFCIDALVWDATGVQGGDEALIHTIYPIRLTGIPLGLGFYADAAGGLVTNTGSMTLSQNGQPVGEIMTADLPTIGVGAWDTRVHGSIGAAGIELRSRRSGWISLDGDMTVEDRGTAAIGLRAGGTAFGLSGFVANTRWWTAANDPGQAARTGGAELTVGRRIAGLDVVASAGAARTFYATLDGGAPTDTGVGFRGGISISRPVWGSPAAN